MLIDRIPNFLVSPSEYYDFFAFDSSGRFIFCNKKNEKGEQIFIIYDILFNKYVELTPNPSNPNIATQYGYDCIWEHIRYFLPVSFEQVLISVQSGETNVLLLLVHFDLDKKIYEILNSITITKCQKPEFVRDGEDFALFCLSTINGEISDITNTENSFLMLKYFTIQDNHIILGNGKRFNFTPLNSTDYPLDLYLRNNKLWYFRQNHSEIIPALAPQYSQQNNIPDDNDPTKDILRICYFDLNENLPFEIFVSEIEIEESEVNPILQWVQDSLLLFGTKFDVFNLLTYEWTSEALNSGVDFTNLNSSGKWQANETWIEYQCSKNPTAEWAYYAAVHIDDEYIITAVNRKSSTLHRIPLKMPLRLTMIAWAVALNAGLIHENTSIPPKLPYSRVL